MSRATKLKHRLDALIKAPPQKIKPKPALSSVDKHSLALRFNVPQASTDITAYEVQVALLQRADQLSGRIAPVPVLDAFLASDVLAASETS